MPQMAAELIHSSATMNEPLRQSVVTVSLGMFAVTEPDYRSVVCHSLCVRLTSLLLLLCQHGLVERRHLFL